MSRNRATNNASLPVVLHSALDLLCELPINRPPWLTGCTLLLLATVTPSTAPGEDAKPIRVVVWDEQQPAQKQAYENFLGNAIADHLLKQPGITVRSMKQDDAEQGSRRRSWTLPRY